MPMNKNRIILVDVDGVLLNWLDGFIRYMEHQGYKNVREHIDHDDLGYRFDIQDKQIIDQQVRRFNSGQWEFGTLPPLNGAIQAIKHLNTKLNYRFVCITSCTTGLQTIALRKANLYNVFGDVFDAIHFVDHKEPKNTHLADYDSTFWIEDKTVNAEAGLIYEHDCIIMNHLYNAHDQADSRITRCSSWDEIVNYIENKP